MMNKKSITWGTIGAFILGMATLYGVYLQHREEERKSGGIFEARFHESNVPSDGHRTIVVCTDNADNAFTNVSVTPTVNNPSRYPLPGFSLELHVNAYNMELTPTDYYPMARLDENEYVFTYKDDKLLNQHFTPKVFQSLRIAQGKLGRCTIHMTATYEGSDRPFTYNSDVWLLLVPNTKNLSFENWKLSCKNAIYEHVETGLIYDEYYFTQNGQTFHDFDLSLPADEQAPLATTMAEAPQKNEPEASQKSEPLQKPEVPTSTASTLVQEPVGCTVSRSPDKMKLQIRFPIVADTTYYVYAVMNAAQDTLRHADWAKVTPRIQTLYDISMSSPTDTIVFLQAAPERSGDIESTVTDDGFINLQNKSKEPVVALVHLTNGHVTTKVFDHKVKSYTFSYNDSSRVASIETYRYNLPDTRSWWDKWGSICCFIVGFVFFFLGTIFGLYMMITEERKFSEDWWESVGTVATLVFFMALFIWLCYVYWP